MNRADEAPGVVRFGSYEADLRVGELRKAGTRLKLQEQPFQVLTMLLERPGEIVTRDELKAKLWPSDTFVDFDNSLNTDINKLREALGDSAANPRFVETVPRRGYRFVAPVSLPEAELPAAPRSRTLSRRAALALISVPVATAVGAWLLRGRISFLKSAGRALPSLAVLPLENLSRDSEQEYFTNGLTDELITCFAKLGSLSVISRTSVMHYKGLNKKLSEVAHELNVDFIVAGSVFRDAERIRINAELVDAATNKNLWGEQYDRDLQDIMPLQNEVARDIAREIHLKLTPQDEARLQNARQVNREAYLTYLKGRYYVTRFTKPDMEKAATYFDKAIGMDPTFALAYDGLAAYYLAGTEFFIAPQHAIPRAKAAAIKAQQLDDTAAEPHVSLGMTLYFYDYDWSGAEKEFRRAIELNPSHAYAHSYLGWTYATRGRFPEAYDEMKRAQELDPLSTETNAFVGWILYFMGRYDEASQQLLTTIARDANFWPAHVYLGHVYEKQGLVSKAIEEYEKAGKIEDSVPELLAPLGRAYAISGRKNEALKVLARLQAMRKQGYVPAYCDAVILAALGRNDEAFERLEKAYDDRSFYMTWLKIHPDLDSLRSDPRFQDLMRRMRLPQ